MTDNQPFDRNLYGQVLTEAGYEHNDVCDAPASPEDFGIEAAAGIAARLVAARKVVVTDNDVEKANLVLSGCNVPQFRNGPIRRMLQSFADSLNSRTR